MINIKKPSILAPAGDRDSFLAAVAAGADAIYCGLKIFSARMEAENFGIEELARLTVLAASKKIKVYIAFNSIIKQGELEKVKNILSKITRYVHPDALIVQDIGMISLAREAGFQGELHLSTLGNCCFTKGLDSARQAGFSRVVLPRELNIDEIKTMAGKAPEGLELEVFIHGALCYGVSGRCYWSSWFGGKSGLRGRCVQPCRRIYTQNQNKQRFFSCFDLSLDVLVKVLKDIPEVTCWKIEGRKKSPHYVFYAVKAYKMLRDHGHEPDKKKTALAFLNYALGRPSTHYNFLPQRPQNPLKKDVETGSGLFTGRVKIGTKPFLVTREALLTNDLLRIGYEDDKGHAIQRVTRSVPKKGKLVLKQGKKGKLQKGMPVFIVDRREKDIALLIKELTVELETIELPHVMPVEGSNTGHLENLHARSLKFESNEKQFTSSGKAPGKSAKGKQKLKKSTETTDILLHRKFSCLNKQTATRSMAKYSGSGYPDSGYSGKRSKYSGKGYYGKGTGYSGRNYSERRKSPYENKNNIINNALWISNKNIEKTPAKLIKNIWWWLPPVMWPENDEKNYSDCVKKILSKGGRHFILNIPWQIALFNEINSINPDKNYRQRKKINKFSKSKSGKSRSDTALPDKSNITCTIKGLDLWAGPFCNTANTACLNVLKKMGFSGAIVSPELDQDTFLSLPGVSPLPLGAVIKGNWPLSISRIISDDIRLDQNFSSPMGENCWVSKQDENYWVFPGWELDLSRQKEEMKMAGYSFFINIDEDIPKKIIMKKRPGLWNWKLRLL